MQDEIPIHPDLVWDYEPPPKEPMWRLQRIADAFPAYGRDRQTVRALHEHRHTLCIEPEIRGLIELYEEAWRQRERGAQNADP